MKVKRIEFRLSHPEITDSDQAWNREQLGYLVELGTNGVSCISAGKKKLPVQYSTHTVSSIASAMGDDRRRSIEEYSSGASNIFFGGEIGGPATGFVQVRPSVLFLVHPDECFSRWFTQAMKDGWHRAVYSQVYDEVVILWWGVDDDDNDIIPELDKCQSVYGRHVLKWRPGEMPPKLCRDNFYKWKAWEVDVAGCFKEECVAAWCDILENWAVPYNLLDELIVKGYE